MDQNKLINPKNRLSVTIIISIVVVMLILTIARFALNDLIEKVELKAYDWRAKIACLDRKYMEDIILLVVDDISLQNAISHPEIGLGRWPWPRKAHADIINYLKRSGARAIIFDVIFQGTEGLSSTNSDSDQALISSLKGTDNVFFAVSFTYSQTSLKSFPNYVQLKDSLLNISSPALRKVIKRFALNLDVDDINDEIKKKIEFYNVSNLLEGIMENCASIGSVTLPQSLDGINRSVRPLTYFNNNYYPSLPLAVYLKLKPETIVSVKDRQLFLDNKSIPLDQDGAFYVNWYGPSGTFKHFRALDVILAQKNLDAGNKDPLDPSKFKDKIVIIGITATATDILPTPMAAAYPGPEIIASTINNLITSEKYITKISPWLSFLIVILLASSVGSIVLFMRSGFFASLISLVIIGGYVWLTVYSFTTHYLWMDVIFPSLAIVFTIMVTFMSKYIVTRKAFEDTYKLATTDNLTGLFNQRYFQEIMNVSLHRARRYKYDISLLFVDIDYFKNVNDTYGHRAGDMVLKEVAARIKTCFRATDTCARYGGEELAIILESTSFPNAIIAAQKLLNVINSKEFNIKEQTTIKITVSIGIASFPKHADSVIELIELADQAMYHAKQSGRNCISTIEDRVGNGQIGDKSSYEHTFTNINLKVDNTVMEKLKNLSRQEKIDDIARWIVDFFKSQQQ